MFSHTGSDSLYFNREGRHGPGGVTVTAIRPTAAGMTDSGYVWRLPQQFGAETSARSGGGGPSYGNFVCGKGSVIDTWLGLGPGFRLDVADELPDNFIEKIRAAVKAHGEDKLLIGEV